MKSRVSVACLGLLAFSGAAFAEGQALSANGGSAGSLPAKVGAGNQLPDVKTPYAPAVPSSRSRVGDKLPVDGAADRPNGQQN
jgi:hypothetical protein